MGSVGVLSAGEYMLVSSDNSMTADGQGNFDAYVVGDGSTAASGLEVKSLGTKLVRKKTLEVNPLSLTSCGGTIRTSDNKWLRSSTYYGALIEVGNNDYVEIQGNATNASSYAFLKSGFQSNKTPNYATGYNSVVYMSVGEDVMLQIPSDAVYLYVYLRSNTVYYTPRGISFYVYDTYECLTAADIVNDLTAGGSDVPLGAEAGKELYNDVIERIDIDVSKLSSCGGTIRTSDNKWKTIAGYNGSLTDVSDIRGENLTIVPNTNGNAFTYTFLKSGFAVNETPDYCNGYSGVIVSSNTITEEVPQDAVYLYVYLNSNDVIYTPSAIYYNKLIKSIVSQNSAELGVVRGQYLDDSVLVQGTTLNADGSDVADDLCVRTFYIPLGGNTSVKLTNIDTQNGNELNYKHTFYDSDKQFVSVTDWGYNAETVIPQAASGGYDRIVIRRMNNETVLPSTTPADIVPYKLAFNIYGSVGLGEYIENVRVDNDKINKALAPRQIEVCSWNIGHFSLGVQKNSTITSSDYSEKLAAFRELIYDTINPRIVGLCEYSRVFGNNGSGPQKASEVLFNDFAIKCEGNQHNYSCNALYANTFLTNIEIQQFDCLQNETITHTSLVKATDYYYLQADLYLEGRFVKLVMTHLAFDNRRPSVLQVAQINELVQKMASYDRVILMGDWNVAAQSDYDGFVNAGYTLGNDGTIITHPSDNKALDSIIVKGVTMTNFSAVQSDLSDHYPIKATISV